ncbi:hypothetical protein DL96DRAFT_1463466 [Flagelloscypha sp. PMI_526]|nr:hypothetical protein DL96DRAFT_1463466 [Flagelloscypha sp. PMI_526]
MSSPSDLPPTGSFISSIRSSCQTLRQASNVAVHPEDILRLLESASFSESYGRVSQMHGLALPLNFSSPLSELNLVSILSLLNFASGYRMPLRKQTGRGAWDSIRVLVLGMYLDDNDLLSAKGLAAMTELKVAELLQVNIHIEQPHESIPGIVVGQLGGPIYELVKLITQTLNETGKILVTSGYPSLGSFVAEALEQGKKKKDEGHGADADVVLERLVTAFPAFRDMTVVNGTPVYCFKKALFLIFAIKTRFGSLNPSPFPVPETAGLPVFTDNVLPSMLIHLGVLDLSSTELNSLFPGADSGETITTLLKAEPPEGFNSPEQPAEGPLIEANTAYILRASAVDACEMIVEHAHSLGRKEVNLEGIDVWLWSIAKDRPDYRALPRFAERATVFY